MWDPLSSSQTERAVSLLRRLMDDYPTVSPEQPSTQQLLSAATLRLREAVDNDVFIPLCSNKHLENSASQRYIFYQRQFWSCVKVGGGGGGGGSRTQWALCRCECFIPFLSFQLLSNITKWEGLVATDTLQELAIDGLLNRCVCVCVNALTTVPLPPPPLLCLGTC